MTRRAALGLFLLPMAASAEARPLRIVCLDDGLAETLLMLGVRPVAIADREVWETWVVEPPLPPEIADVGTLLEPNLEFLQQLKPDIILSIPYLDGIKPQLERVAPVKTIGLYTEAGEPYRLAVEATRELARLTRRQAESEALIAATEACFTETRQKLAPLAARPVYIVNFLDPRNVRVYGARSLFQAVFDRIGIRNAWTGETNYWGFSTVGIDGLATASDARLAFLEPMPEGAGGTLTESPVWNAMPFVRNRSIMRLPAVLMFGGLPSAARFARVLTRAMTGENGNG
ncbi:MAG: iron-siderophore ABC transporter substrate-binding protein [Mesorhizobium sp.]|nr:iron-siderophore ABC transporter substrate-binding protein [Mesorhizobium sp. M4B.F.Ca.ET.058.02.1.1]RVC40003.1 iron-siderophore ABC transporter substrate-binding protein [Mesorhizobium sp. M4A.F.Ca.ET.090.04.2.1]RWC10193.1 MAG: iron-siderophore ABC transporter substrate-binding protein [Mesorhizobium sp.]RWD01507.1 MAG: iron-siderophore ABC transporter substrate-binding protein [Mesorhizobium sp.]RWD14951.1 MAG: iron-siderophore ABC transporter substrate-binding protein [Mesorhizobium sp.]